MPEDEAYDGSIDIDRDTPERLYEEQAEQAGNSAGEGEPRGDNGDGEGGGGSGTDAGPEEDLPQKQEQDGARTDDGLPPRERLPGEQNPRSAPDLVDDADSINQSSTGEQRFRRLLEKINATYEQVSRTYGHGAAHDAVVAAMVRDELAPKVDWRVLLYNRLTAMQLDEKSLSCPDRRFVHKGLYVEGPVAEDELLADIRICVDTSASMSDTDVAIALKQIGRLIKQYRVDAQLVFWDEEVEVVAPFSDRRQYERVQKQAVGRGGTNPNCLFEAFSRRGAFDGVQKKTRMHLCYTMPG